MTGKHILMLAVSLLFGISLTACGNSSKEEETVTLENAVDTMKIDENKTYQTIESFGTSGCWWSQYVGGFEKTPYNDGIETREKIAELLFDKEKGIGLNSYRYNLGAGSAQSNKGTFWDPHRKAQSFLDKNGEYDFSKDAKAVWFLKKAVELGVEEVTFFCNSPLEIYTINGTAQTTKGSNTNISKENYAPWANYCYDVCEHFINEGIPIKFLSPINEPQWEWIDGQEGCHYEPDQVRDVFLVFLEELEKRPELYNTIRLSGPEGGEWKGKTMNYTSAILDDETLSKYFDTIDNHSYWSTSLDKKNFKSWMNKNYPDVKLRMSEWCEMVNGSDVTMDSAFHISQEIANDLRILDAVSWTNWVGVAPGGYRDGLIYIDEKTQKFNPLKRLYSFGNFSKFIKPGYVRVDISPSNEKHEKMLPTAFKGMDAAGQEELVLVFINEDENSQEFCFEGIDGFTKILKYVTSDEYNLECTSNTDYSISDVITIDKKSVTTIILKR